MLFVVGYHASGKSHFAKMLQQHYGAMHVETSSIVRELKEREAPNLPMRDWATTKEAEFGSSFFDELIVTTIRERYVHALESGYPPNEIIITGNRSLGGIRYASENLSDLHPRPTRIFAIDAHEDVRYRRFCERDRYEGDATMPFESFQKLICEERDAGIDEIFLHADIILSNNGSAEAFAGLSRLVAEYELGLKRYNSEGEDLRIYLEGNHKENIR